MKENLIISWHPGQILPFSESHCHLSIGVFDGLHWGHRNILGRLRHQKKGKSDKILAVTFLKNPKQIKNPSSFQGNLSLFSMKCQELLALGVDAVIAIDFSEDFSKMEGKDFIHHLLETVKLRSMVVGYDFAMGHKSSTKAQDMRGFLPDSVCLSIMPPVFSHNSIISSSKIRNYLLKDSLNLAVQMLGKPYLYVLPGTQVDRGWGASQSDHQILPSNGRYLVMIEGVHSVLTVEDGHLSCDKGPLSPGAQIFFQKTYDKEI